MLEDQVVVAVVVENAALRMSGAGGDDQVDWREAMVTRLRKLVLSSLGQALDFPVNRKAIKSLEPSHGDAMVLGRLRGEPSLQQERQAGSQPARSDPVEDDLLAILRNAV